ncbi:MAG: four helix bundle protein [Armatimonadetes bacterium]|nr:four helix bundle protein [Armatimonadota bacterium]
MREAAGFEDLEVWNSAMEFAELVYRVSAEFPREEQYALVSQLRRAAVSIPSNIAEGWGRGPGAANLNHARIARGSCYEVRTQLLLADRLGLASSRSVGEAIDRLGSLQRLLGAYVRGMEAKHVRETPANYGADDAD